MKERKKEGKKKKKRTRPCGCLSRSCHPCVVLAARLAPAWRGHGSGEVSDFRSATRSLASADGGRTVRQREREKQGRTREKWKAGKRESKKNRCPQQNRLIAFRHRARVQLAVSRGGVCVCVTASGLFYSCDSELSARRFGPVSVFFM